MPPLDHGEVYAHIPRPTHSARRLPPVRRSGEHVLSVTLLALTICLLVMPASMAAQSGQLPRTPAGHPDMNGIWQALGNAHWDIEPHTARPALAMRPGPVVPVPADQLLALGAVGSVPSGYGVVEGGAIPYTAAALDARDENRAEWLGRDPEI